MWADPELAPMHDLVLPDFTDVAVLREWRRARNAGAPPPAVTPAVDWADRTIPGPADAPELPVRIYRPQGAGARAALVYFHGGSMVMGDLDGEHGACLWYAEHAGCVVVSVDYRLAPERRFPAALEDGYAALRWTAAAAAELGVDPGRLAVGGASAGGTLAAAVALLARDRGGPPLRAQMLIYPALDDRLDSPSMHAMTTGHGLTRSRVGWMWKHYLGGDGVAPSAYAAPARAEDLTGLPRAFVEVGSLDPLRDECIDFAQRLLQAGVPTDLQVICGAPHGFDAVRAAAATQRAFDQRTAILKSALAAAQP